jgi:CRP-like cAMP-binding protein
VEAVLADGRRDRHTRNVLQSLSEADEGLLTALTGRSTLLPPNRQIVDEGEVGGNLFQITDGWAFRYRRRGKTCRQIVDFLLPGEIIGLHGALLGTLDHSVRSLTSVRLTAFDGRLVGEAFEKSPSLAIRFARSLGAGAGRAEELMTVIGCCDAMARLSYLMLSLYCRQVQRHEDKPLGCPFPLRRQHMADALGLTGAHVNRTINRLRDDGIAALGGGRLSILDLPRLKEIAGIGN